jgi:hypothetical protein
MSYCFILCIQGDVLVENSKGALSPASWGFWQGLHSRAFKLKVIKWHSLQIEVHPDAKSMLKASANYEHVRAIML